MNRPFVSLVSLLLLLVIAGRADAQWAQFRGPNGSGVDSSAGYPVEFSPTRNVAWKASVPYGQSSPVVVGTRLYVTASEGDRLITFCLDTQTGRELWRRELRRDRAQAIYKANDPASPTPAADENGVVAFFPEFGLVSYNKRRDRCAGPPASAPSRTSTEWRVRQSSTEARSCWYATSRRGLLSLRSTGRPGVSDGRPIDQG